MLILFVLGSLSTVIGILLSGWLLNIKSDFGESYDILAGMFTGTYTGGSINFNAIAIQYNFQENGLLFAGAVAIDNVVTTFWMLVTLLIPRWVKRKNSQSIKGKSGKGVKLPMNSLSMKSLIVLLSLGFVCLWVSWQTENLTAGLGFKFPSILVLTTLALVLAQFPIIRKMKGAEILGLYSVYLFLAVIGAYCDIAAVTELAGLGIALVLFTFISVVIHGLIIYTVGHWLFRDWEMTSIASQANVGGGTTALALAETFGRHELLLPAILIGSLGNALGTYLGFLVISIL